MKKIMLTAGIAVVVTAAIAATTKFRYCGSSSYGRGFSNGVHEK